MASGIFLAKDAQIIFTKLLIANGQQLGARSKKQPQIHRLFYCIWVLAAGEVVGL
jgi:hypothetical protein